MKKIILMLIASLSLLAADKSQDYWCELDNARMLGAELTPKDGETTAMSVSSSKISTVEYRGTFVRTDKSRGNLFHYYKGNKEGVELVWLPKQQGLGINYKDHLFSLYYNCIKR